MSDFISDCKIGNLELENRLLLAPMLEPNDIAFRLLCKRAGCGLVYVGMTSPLSQAKFYLDDKPALQLFGNSPKGIESFMKKYDSKVSLWDFNLGCPSKLSRRLVHGAFMSGEVEMIKEILKVMRSSTEKPVTIKIRKSDDAIEIARTAESIGVDAICIHARTVAQGYSGEVDYDFALKVKAAVNVPIIFSGDVDENNVDDILKDFDFVMAGRSCIGNPGFFAKFSKKKVDVGFGEYLKLAKKYRLFFRQVKYQAMNFTKGVVGGKALRIRLIGAKDVGDIEEIMGKNK
jgi:tRNA-dihydrouridine synthase B